MILFLFGDDSYRSKQKLDAIKTKYITASLGDTNLSTADLADKEIDFTQITRMILALPFLAKKRLVIIKNLLDKGKQKLQEQVLDFLDKVPESTLLVFYEQGKPDRRKALFKKLNKPKMSQEFKLLEGGELRKWIKDEVEKQAGKIEPAAVEKLTEYVGNDLWRMNNEISKLISYTGTQEHRNIETKDVELLVKPKIEGNVFGMIDALGQKNSKQAVQALYDLLESGENELYILTMIVYQFRNLLIIKDSLGKNPHLTSHISHLAREAGLHPFVVQKTITQAKNFTFDQLKKIYQKLLDFDIKIKSGKIESKTALDVLVIELSS